MSKRRLLTVAFSLLFGYMMAFVFESPVFYRLAEYYRLPGTLFALTAVLGVFFSLFTCGFFIGRKLGARTVMLGGIGVCVAATVPFFLPLPPPVLLFCFMACALGAGYANAAWGYCLKEYNSGAERMKICADILIYSNLMLIPLQVISAYVSPLIGLGIAWLYVVLAGVFAWFLPAEEKTPPAVPPAVSLRLPMLLLFCFVVVITINSGLMYQVFNPSFSHLTLLTSLYWVVPYVAGLALMRNLPARVKRSNFLYVGMVMIMLSFVAFMLMAHDAVGYLVVNTLMLGACGIFDLFWWSILGDTLDYTPHPVRIFGIGLSANVLGVLLGGLIGSFAMASGLPAAHITVIAVSVLAVTLIILPHLNHHLSVLLKNHAYLTLYAQLPAARRTEIIRAVEPHTPLSEREHEVLQLILSGHPNKMICTTLFISESTVKTHVKNIFAKYGVSRRTELISKLLQPREQP